ncbi:MAG TPA: glycosyltransferase family 2 protein [Solirubrobacterales bacterium]|nr:glycosyltransferase family 2 protein [Solirubrobacterales bacterium]
MALPAEEVAALVPCHREPPAAELLAEVRARVGSVLVVNDGMGEGPTRELEGRAARLGLEALHLGANRGKGHAIAAGIGELRGRARPPAGVLVVDADGQHPPAAIPRFLEASGRAELVIGNRFADGGDGMPPVRHASNRFVSRVVSRATGTHVPDSQCGMRLLHGRALHVEFPGGGMESETRHLIDCLRAEVPTHWVPIPAIYEGQPTSFRRLRDSLSVLHAAFTSPPPAATIKGPPRGGAAR